MHATTFSSTAKGGCFRTSQKIVNSIPKLHWNFGKAGWEKFIEELDHNIQHLGNDKRNIPRGHNKTCIRGWSRECTRFYEENEVIEDLVDERPQCLDSFRREKWGEVAENQNFQLFSKKACSFRRKLDDCQPNHHLHSSNIKPNTIKKNSRN